MRFSLLVLVLLLAGCSQLSAQLKLPFSGTDSGKQGNIEEQIQAIVQQLQREPDWLLPSSACPGDVMPVAEEAVQHFAKDCALNPIDCFKHCIDKNGSACYGLALFLQEQAIEAKSIEEKYVELLFGQACQLGIVSGCTNRAAGMLALETNDEADLQCIARTFEKTCAKADPWGCTMYGTVLSQGIGCDRDLEKALKILPKACNKYGQSDPACQQAQQLRKKIYNLVNDVTP